MTTTSQAAVVGAVSELTYYRTKLITTGQTEVGQSVPTNLFQTMESHMGKAS